MFGSLEPEAYFWGETLEKLGARKYRLTNGGFTTCVQPTPRWELSSSTVVLNLRRLRGPKERGLAGEGRAALLSTRSSITRCTKTTAPRAFSSHRTAPRPYKGQALSNAFFWAINRSHDVTLLHDWFSRRRSGHGHGVPLRAGSRLARLRARLQPQRARSHADSTRLVAHRSKRSLPGTPELSRSPATPRRPSAHRSWLARGHVDYFSDVTVQQTFHTQVFEASRRDRRVWRERDRRLGLVQPERHASTGMRRSSATRNRRLHGGTPRVSFSQGTNSQLLVACRSTSRLAAEYTDLLRQTPLWETKKDDTGLTRLDLSPLVRVPFTRWPFLTINSSVGWTRHVLDRDGSTNNPAYSMEDGITRRYFDLQSRITGPVFVRIWDTPDSSGMLSDSSTSSNRGSRYSGSRLIDNFDQIVKLERG